MDLKFPILTKNTHRKIKQVVEYSGLEMMDRVWVQRYRFGSCQYISVI